MLMAQKEKSLVNPECDGMDTIKTTPAWVWALLVCAVFGVSSAGALFQQVDEIPPLLRASWRLQLTSLVLAPFATAYSCSSFVRS